MKRLLFLLLTVVVLLSVSSCSLFNVVEAPDKVFDCGDFSITLTSGFTTYEMEGYDFAFDSMKIAVFGFKEDFSLFEEGTDLAGYAKLIYEANIDEGLTTIQYESYDSDEKVSYIYYTVLYEGKEAFWTIQFFCDKADFDEYKPYFIKWAKSVEFKS